MDCLGEGGEEGKGRGDLRWTNITFRRSSRLSQDLSNCAAIVASNRRPQSQYGGRTTFNLMTKINLKDKETTLALGHPSVQNKLKFNLNKTWKSSEKLLLTASIIEVHCGK